MKTSFYINGRYLVDPTSNILRDELTKVETRLEPRIMEILCILADKPGVTVTREELVGLVWKDYGGGDEGLTQAISTLRKLLSDTDKELIRTIPKKGYCLEARISLQAAAQSATGWSALQKKTLIPVIAASIVVALLVVLNPFSSEKKLPRETHVAPTEVKFPGMNPGIDSLDQNGDNTIITKGPEGVYKLIMIGDEPPRFYINEKQIPVHEWEPYQQLINNLKLQLQKKNPI